MEKYVAIYVRRSVSAIGKDNNSLSIDSQKADCMKSLKKGENYKIYCDDGKSGKDTNRPAFQAMMADAKDGLIGRIIVKKYDRFARSLRDYLNITNALDKLGIGVTSLSENFDTSTKEGRMMRNNLLNFAEFERETIAARVADAYDTRAQETGFYQGGKVYYGYIPERRTVNGKNGSVLVPSDKADVVRKAYNLYKNPDVSLAKVLAYFRNNGIAVNINPQKNMDRSHLSQILKSPLYVRANREVYQYFVSKGYTIIDDVDAFDGIHGCFRHKQRDGSEYIKVGYHEGLVDADTWLAVQDKKSHNSKYPNNGSAKNSWLTGLVKCAYCHYTLAIVYSWNAAHTKQWRYYIDTGADKATGCIMKRFKTRPEQVEELVFNAMKNRLDELTIAKSQAEEVDTAAEAIKTEVVRLDSEIRKLLDRLPDADDTLFGYIQERVRELDSKKKNLEKEMQEKARKHKKIDPTPLIEPLSSWDKLSIDEKHELAATMIEVVYVSDDDDGLNIRLAL